MVSNIMHEAVREISFNAPYWVLKQSEQPTLQELRSTYHSAFQGTAELPLPLAYEILRRHAAHGRNHDLRRCWTLLRTRDQQQP